MSKFKALFIPLTIMIMNGLPLFGDSHERTEPVRNTHQYYIEILEAFDNSEELNSRDIAEAIVNTVTDYTSSIEKRLNQRIQEFEEERQKLVLKEEHAREHEALMWVIGSIIVLFVGLPALYRFFIPRLSKPAATGQPADNA